MVACASEEPESPLVLAVLLLAGLFMTAAGVAAVLAPYGAAMMTSALRVSNAKAKADLGWEPSVPTYREGIARIASTLRRDRRGDRRCSHSYA
jgi:nucleoside-diphosphate-sugar epimerase